MRIPTAELGVCCWSGAHGAGDGVPQDPSEIAGCPCGSLLCDHVPANQSLGHLSLTQRSQMTGVAIGLCGALRYLHSERVHVR